MFTRFLIKKCYKIDARYKREYETIIKRKPRTQIARRDSRLGLCYKKCLYRRAHLHSNKRKESERKLHSDSVWYRWPDLNRHGSPQRILSPSRLPIPSHRLNNVLYYKR